MGVGVGVGERMASKSCSASERVSSGYTKARLHVHVTSFITSRPVCVYSCSQLRELWFNALFMYILCRCIIHCRGYYGRNHVKVKVKFLLL